MKPLVEAHQFSNVIGNCMRCNRHMRLSILQLEQMERWNGLLAMRGEELFTPGNFQPCDRCNAKEVYKQETRDKFVDDRCREYRAQVNADAMSLAEFEMEVRTYSESERMRYAQDFNTIRTMIQRRDERR